MIAGGYKYPISLAAPGGAGGCGIVLSQGGNILNNAGTIVGGAGGNGGYSFYAFLNRAGGGLGGSGGSGILLSQAGSIDNSGLIAGGAGGDGGAV